MKKNSIHEFNCTSSHAWWKVVASRKRCGIETRIYCSPLMGSNVWPIFCDPFEMQFLVQLCSNWALLLMRDLCVIAKFLVNFCKVNFSQNYRNRQKFGRRRDLRRVRRRPNHAHRDAVESQLSGTVRACAPMSLDHPRGADAEDQFHLRRPWHPKPPNLPTSSHSMYRRQRRGTFYHDAVYSCSERVAVIAR